MIDYSKTAYIKGSSEEKMVKMNQEGGKKVELSRVRFVMRCI